LDSNWSGFRCSFALFRPDKCGFWQDAQTENITPEKVDRLLAEMMRFELMVRVCRLLTNSILMTKICSVRAGVVPSGETNS
jgi:hypothetical protein